MHSKKSLLILGIFDEHSMKFIREKCQLKVAKGYMVVVNEELFGNLYRLISKTLMGKAIVANAKSKSPTIGIYERV